MEWLHAVILASPLLPVLRVQIVSAQRQLRMLWEFRQ